MTTIGLMLGTIAAYLITIYAQNPDKRSELLGGYIVPAIIACAVIGAAIVIRPQL